MLMFFEDLQAKSEVNHALQVAKAIGMSEFELMGLYCSYFLVRVDKGEYELQTPDQSIFRRRQAFKNELDRRFNEYERKNPKFDRGLVVSDDDALEVLR